MKPAMKRVIAAVMLVVMLLSNVNMASALVANPLFYGDYTDVAKIYDSNSCPSMQGLAVGSQMMYAIKIKTDNSRAVITMTDKDSGETTTLKDASTGNSYFTGLDHANDMAVWGIDGSSHIFVATTKQGANAIVRYRRSGSNLYKVATYHLQCGGSDICATAMDVMNVDSSGNIHLITKWGQDIYTGTVHKDTGDTTVNMTKICTISKDMAYIKGEKLNLSEWVNQGFGYHDNTLFVPLSGPDDALHRSVVLVYNLDNVPLGATIYPTDYLAFRVTSSAGYPALFEIESVDICSSDGKLYFNTNRRKTTSDTNHDGISWFDGYTYTKPTAASFDAVKHFNAKFLPNGGTGTMANQRINNGIGTALSKNLYTKPGYTFVGWTAHRLAQNQWYYCTDRSTTGWYAEGKQPSGYSLYIYYDQQKVSATSNVHADTVEYVAQWTPTNYTVKFDANGGTGTAIADKSFTIENPGTLPANTFTKEGYTFAGWQVSGLGDVLQPGASTTDLINYAGQGNNTDNTITLLANWEANDYTVTWNVDGEKFTTTTVKYGQPITAPAYTAPEGHTFSGWNVPATMPAENITLDATLTVNTYTITWNVRGNITTETYSYGEIPSYKGNPENERHGCTVFYFTGWNQNPAAVTGDFTYIAQFTPATSHTQIVTDAAVEPGCTKTGLTEGSHCEACGNVIVAQEVVDAKGHSEKPVYTNNGDTHSAVYPCCGETYVTGEAHSYTDGKCVCQAVQKVTITLDGNGGRLMIKYAYYSSYEHIAEYGQEVTVPIYPRHQSREGYTFNGFNTEADGSGTRYTALDALGLDLYIVTSDMTLYAQWKPIQYTAQFLPGEGTGEAMPDIPFTIESTEGLPECTYTREGYTFSRWRPSGTGNLFSPGWSLANMASYAGYGDSTGTTIKLVAQWEPNKHTITWTINGEEYAQTTGTYGQPITKPEWTTPDGYTFFDWNPPETMPDEDITLDAKKFINSYDLIFQDSEGNILTKDFVQYGDPIEYPDSNKEGHTFHGWDYEGTTMPPHVLTITGNWTANTYKVTFTVEGQEYATADVVYGQSIPLPETDPEKEGYRFNGWKDLPETMPAKDLTLAADFVEQVTITYLSYDADKMEYVVDWEGKYDKGATITLGYYYWNYCNTLGWDTNDDGVVDHEYQSEYTVTGDVTMKPVLVPFYADVDLGAEDAVFVDAEGNPITRIYAESEYHNYVTLTNHPTRKGYTFLGWYVDEGYYGKGECLVYTNEETGELEVSMSFGTNATATAMWEANTYNVTYTINGETYETVPVKYGEAVTAPEYAIPEGHTFSGWDVPAVMPAEDITLDATLTINSYTVTFNVNGEIYKTASFEYGAAVEAPDYDVPVGHTFSGWDVPETMPAEDITLNATLALKTYTVTWLDEAENVVATEAVKHGENAINVPDVPEKEAYTGAWSADAVNVTSDLTIKPVYTAVEYTLIMLPGEGAEGEPIIKTFTIESEGTIPSDEPSFTKLGYYQNYWWLSGKETGDIDDAIGKRYPYKDLIQFADENNSVTLVARWVICDYKIYVGTKLGEGFIASAIYQTPLAEVEESFVRHWNEELTWEGHTLTGWKWFEDAAETKVYTGTTMPAYALYAVAQWEANTYTVTWMVDGQEYSKTEVKCGDPIVKPADPAKEQEGCAVYTFTGWAEEIPDVMPAKDLTFTGSITEKIEHVNIYLEGYKAPTCTEDGYSGDTYCECGEELGTGEVLPATGHSGIYYFNGNRLSDTRSMLILVFYCKTCKQEVHQQSRYVTGEIVQEATCTSIGKTDYTFDFSDVRMIDHVSWDNFEFSSIAWAGAEKTWNPETKIAEARVNNPQNKDNHSSTEVTYKNITETTHDVYHACCDTLKEEGAAHDYTHDAEKHICACDAVEQITVRVFWNGADQDPMWTLVEDYGTTTTIPTGAAPTGYHFVGFAKTEDGQVFLENPEYTYTESIDLYPVFQENTYTVTFTVDGKSFATTEATFGQAIPLPEAEPEKEGYRFNGWKDVPETMPANENLTIEADFIEQATITYLCYDIDKMEYVLDWEGKYDKGATITLGYYYWNYCNTLGWDTNDDGVVDHEYNSEYTVTEDVTMKPVLVPFYADVDLGAEDAVFVDAEGNDITRIYAENEYHNFVTLTNHPTRKGYTFLGWYVDQGYYGEGECLVYTNDETGELEVSLSFGSNATATAMWEINTYNVTYTINGEAYQTVPVKYGETVTAPEYDIPEAHTFSGWDVPETMPAEDITLDAALTVNSYTVTFKVDGEIYKTASFEYGAAVEAPDYDVPVGHTFSGWDVPETMPAEDITLNATVKVNEHKLTLDFDGVTFYSFLTNSEGVYGYSQYLPPELEFPMDYGEKFSNIIIPGVKTGHNFSHFQDQFGNKYELVKKEYLITDSPNPGTTQMFDVLVIESMPDHDLILTPVWTLGTYTVNFYINYQQYTSIEVLYGDPVQAPDYTVPEGYIFSGWDVPATMPGHGLTLHANLTPKTYTVTWLDEAENVVATEAVKHGENAINVPDVPEKEAYTGAWSADAVNVTSDLTIKPEYTAVEYTLIMLPGEGAEGERTTMTFTIESEDIILFMEPSFTKLGHHQNYWWLEGKETGNFDDMIGAKYHYKDLIQFADENNSVTLVARWVISLYRVSVMRKPGEVVVSTAVGYQTPLAEVEATIVHLWGEELTWEGHTLTGWKWFEDEAGTKAYTGTTIPTYALYAAAQWEANTYTVTWMVDGQEYSKTEVKCDDPIVKPADPTKTGYNFLGWKDDQGNVVEFPCNMPAQNVTYTAEWEKAKYTVTYIMNGGEAADGGMEIVDDKFVSTMVHGTTLGFSADGVVKEGHTLIGVLVNGEHLNPDESYVVVSDTLVELQWEANTYTVTWYYRHGEQLQETYAYGATVNGFIPERFYINTETHRGWFDHDWWYIMGSLNDHIELPFTMPAENLEIASATKYTGWMGGPDQSFFIYVKDYMEQQGWFCVNDKNELVTDGSGKWYYAGSDMNVVCDITEIEGVYYAFDHNTGAFLGDYTGIYEAKNGDLYYVENGIAVANKGLVKVTLDDGHIHYYYFGCGVTGCTAENCAGEYKAQKSNRHWAAITNGYLLDGAYTTDADGVIEHIDDTSVTGIYVIDGVKYYLMDGVKVHKGLFKEGEYYYYARSSGALVVDQTYWVSGSKLNGLDLEQGTYTFDSEGRIVFAEDKNGFYFENGAWYYYVDNKLNYAGLIWCDGPEGNDPGYYYINSSCKLVTGCDYWISKNNGYMKNKTYSFDENGTMYTPVVVLKEGIYAEDGSLYYYVEGKRNYAGLIKYTGDLHNSDGTVTAGVYNDVYIYVNTAGEVKNNCSYWISKTNDLMPGMSYNFDKNGIMTNPYVADPLPDGKVKDGIIAENGSLYYYENGVLTYAGLIQIDGNYYYVRTSGEVVNNCSYWISKGNGLMKNGMYNFDANGVITNPRPIV